MRESFPSLPRGTGDGLTDRLGLLPSTTLPTAHQDASPSLGACQLPVALLANCQSVQVLGTLDCLSGPQLTVTHKAQGQVRGPSTGHPGDSYFLCYLASCHPFLGMDLSISSSQSVGSVLICSLAGRDSPQDSGFVYWSIL